MCVLVCICVAGALDTLFVVAMCEFQPTHSKYQSESPQPPVSSSIPRGIQGQGGVDRSIASAFDPVVLRAACVLDIRPSAAH